MSVEPHSGMVLAGRYQLERELGRGGMGSVWLALHTTLHSRVAVKVLSANVQVKDAESRFLFEARAAAQLNTPHIVHLSDFGVHLGSPFLVMELLEGETLGARLAREGKLSPPVTARLLAQACLGVSKAHAAGIVHRDLKPENIFLVDTGHEPLVKVLDFGVAKALQHGAGGPTSTETGSSIGTIPYMAPEQIIDSKRVDTAADVWSLGVIAFECLVGQRPFRGQNAATLVYAICHRTPPLPSTLASVPAGFDGWFARATDADPARRWTSIGDAAAELSRLCGSTALGADPVERTLPTRDAAAPTVVPPIDNDIARTGEPVWSDPQGRKSRFWPWAVGTVLLLVAGAGAWFARSHNEIDPTLATSAGAPDAIPAPDVSAPLTHEREAAPAPDQGPTSGRPSASVRAGSSAPSTADAPPGEQSARNAPPTELTPPTKPKAELSPAEQRPAGPQPEKPLPKEPQPPKAVQPPLPDSPAPIQDPVPKDEPPLFL